MRKRTLGVVLLAGLAISGGGAFTGSNEMVAGSATAKAGYGAVTASGVTVTDSKYLLSEDNSAVNEIRFVVGQGSLAGLTSNVTLTNGASTTPVVDETCSNLSGSNVADVTAAAALTPAVVLTATTSLVRCDITNTPLVNFDKTGLTVFTTGFATNS